MKKSRGPDEERIARARQRRILLKRESGYKRREEEATILLTGEVHYRKGKKTLLLSRQGKMSPGLKGRINAASINRGKKLKGDPSKWKVCFLVNGEGQTRRPAEKKGPLIPFDRGPITMQGEIKGGCIVKEGGYHLN